MIKIIQTAKEQKKYWQTIKASDLSNITGKTALSIAIFPNEKFQQIIGFGGAFTEAACYNIMTANPRAIEKIMKACFAKDGLNYSLGRIAINSCDFALEQYTYVAEGDTNLHSFDLSHEFKYVVPSIMIATAYHNEPLRLVASPWSPPAYMKSNASMIKGGRVKDEFKPLWAEYMACFVKQMRSINIPIEFLSVQNEPEATQRWESCLYTGKEEADFIADHLYPALVKQGVDDTKILAWDHNRDRIVNRARDIYANPKAQEVVWGLAYHWYVSDEHENLSIVHNHYPNKHLLFTEGCVELNNANQNNGEMGLWAHGEFYGRNMINDFNNYCEGWIDWNLVVDEMGGPNQVQNYCEAPIMYNRQTKEVTFNPSYYYIGHFSKYVVPGAYRIRSISSAPHEVLTVSFQNPNKDIVTIMQNEQRATSVAIQVDGQEIAFDLPAHSITTIVMRNKPRR